MVLPLLSSSSLYIVPSSISIRKRCRNPTRTCFEHNAEVQRHGEKIGISDNVEFLMLTLGVLSMLT